jgi:hypothetical protein
MTTKAGKEICNNRLGLSWLRTLVKKYVCHNVFGPHCCNVGIRIYGVTLHKITIFSTIYILFDSHWKYIIKRIYYNAKQIIICWNKPLNNLEKQDNP